VTLDPVVMRRPSINLAAIRPPRIPCVQILDTWDIRGPLENPEPKRVGTARRTTESDGPPKGLRF